MIANSHRRQQNRTRYVHQSTNCSTCWASGGFEVSRQQAQHVDRVHATCHVLSALCRSLANNNSWQQPHCARHCITVCHMEANRRQPCENRTRHITTQIVQHAVIRRVRGFPPKGCAACSQPVLMLCLSSSHDCPVANIVTMHWLQLTSQQLAQHYAGQLRSSLRGVPRLINMCWKNTSGKKRQQSHCARLYQCVPHGGAAMLTQSPLNATRQAR